MKENTTTNDNNDDMHNPESVLENETHKFFCDFEIKTDHQILATWPDLGSKLAQKYKNRHDWVGKVIH